MMLFEFLTGSPPFNGDTVEQVFQNILNRQIPWPDDVSPEARDLIDKLMAVNPSERLGHNGADDIKRHPFFKGINWTTVRTQKPIFVPKPDNAQDTSYFDAREKYWNTTRISQDGMGDGSEPQVEEDAKFDDFWYVNFRCLSELNENLVVNSFPPSSRRRRHSL